MCSSAVRSSVMSSGRRSLGPTSWNKKKTWRLILAVLFLCSYWSTAPTRRRVPQTERPDELSTVVHIDSLLEIKPADSRERSALIPIFCWFNDLSAANKHFQLTDGDLQTSTSTAVCSGSLCLTWWVGFYIKPVKPLNERVYFLFSIQTFV